jgi:DNA-binding MarR family transcriptional regulator
VNDISIEDRVGPVAGYGAPGSGAGEPAGGSAELLAAISAVRRTARRAVRQAWARPPLPPAQGELLLLVARRPGITVAESAQELHLAQNTVSTLVSRLTAEELLIRGRDATDGRAALLTITAKAQDRLNEYRDLRAELADRALAELPAADQRALAAAVPALRRLAEWLQTG